MRVHVLAPEGFDDPGQPSGGNIYDRRVFAGLAEAGWEVLVTAVPRARPASGAAAALAQPGTCGELERAVCAIPGGETVLIDGLLASPAAAQLLPHAGRLALTVLLHMPLVTALAAQHDASIQASERAVLQAAAGVIVTSEWTRQQILDWHGVPAAQVHVAWPGADLETVPPEPARGRLVCVGELSYHKGQDVLVEALASLAGLDWHCVLAGPLDRDPGFVGHLQTRIAQLGFGGRVQLAGVLAGAALSRAYRTADLLVAPSRSETYGMSVTEALAHGLPVLAASTGGLPEAVGCTASGIRPGQLVPPGDPAALAAALADWLGDQRRRQQLRAAAWQRRATLPGWEQTTAQVAAALALARPGCGA